MDDTTLFVRLVRLSDGAFAELLGVCVPHEAHAWLPAASAPRAERCIALARHAANDGALRERIVERLGGDDPIGAWVGWGLAQYRNIPVLGFRGQVVLSLDTVFVQLQVSAGFADPMRRGRERDIMESPVSHTVSPGEALAMARQRGHAGIVLLGDPGSGKTTLLQHLYTRVAQGEGEALGVAREAVPVLVRAAAVEASQRVSGGLREVLAAEARRNGHPNAAERLRDEPRPWLVFLDGLDEVRDEATRVALCRWLDGELSHFRDAAFVVSCRYAAWQREATLSQRFLPVDVLLLDDARVREYVERWFRAVAFGLRGVAKKSDDDCVTEARARSERVLAVLLNPARHAQLRLRNMTGNPLLLSTLCLVSFEDNNLPEQRSELYDRCIRLLLETWTERKGLPALPERQARNVLQPLAWAMHTRDLVDASGAELEPIVAEALREVQGLPLSARELLERARDDCGVFTSRDVDQYRFLHLTFQEYLAARHAQVRRLEATLAEHADDPRWQEVILLAVARGGLFEHFFRVLVAQGKLRPCVALLRECLLDADVLPERAFVEVLDALAAARNAAAAWTPPPWWRTLLRPAPPRPTVAPAQIGDAAAVLTLLRGRPLAAVRARAEALCDDTDAALRDAARAFLDRPQEAPRAPTQAPTPGGGFVEPVTGMLLRWIPAGSFVMGSADDDPEAYASEKPAHRVTLTEGYYLGQHPVTNAQYQRYVQETGARAPVAWTNRRFNDPQLPVVEVDHDEALAFCAWLTTTARLDAMGLRATLPTEAQWEYAARGADGRRYPWGNDAPTKERAVWGLPSDKGGTSRIGEHTAGQSPFGCEDMAGNVWEWCRDAWRDNYGSREAAVDPCHDGDTSVTRTTSAVPRVVRGGSWSILARDLRCAYRGQGLPQVRGLRLGFRVVVVGSRQHG